jgi:hypothetical protein
MVVVLLGRDLSAELEIRRFVSSFGKSSLPALTYLLSCGRLRVTAPQYSTHILRVVLFHCKNHRIMDSEMALQL